MMVLKTMIIRTPPAVNITPTWREIYEREAFAQRELIGDMRLQSAAKSRELHLGIGRDALEDLDLSGALRPIAFAEDAYSVGFRSLPVPSDLLQFKDEGPPDAWRHHRWESEMEPGLPNVSPLYSPWQLLYIDDVLKGTGYELALETLLLQADARERALDQLRPWADQQNRLWRALDGDWSPLVKLLVCAQNRYWPRVTNRVAVIPDPGSDGHLIAGGALEGTSPRHLMQWIGCSVPEITACYHFLVERGISRDPEDGLTLLRRARPRAFHLRWRGPPLRAQDNFDAAELLRLFMAEVAGDHPGRVDLWPADGRQFERGKLYDRGPAAPWTPQEIKSELLTAELYPHGVHIIGEGASEWIVTKRLIEYTAGSAALKEVEFLDLGGSGAARYVSPLSQALGNYAIRAFVIVDREGKIAEYLSGAISRKEIDEADVLLFDDSLEASNLNSDELIDLARKVARDSVEDPSLADFRLTARELERAHADRVSASSDNPGLAETLIIEIGRRTPSHLQIDKVVLAEALADFLARELAGSARHELHAVKERRPIVAFVLDRVIATLNRPRPAGFSP
jgi:hypothetical protein